MIAGKNYQAHICSAIHMWQYLKSNKVKSHSLILRVMAQHGSVISVKPTVSLSPVHTGDYSRRIWRLLPNFDSRRFRQQSPFPATIVCSVDRALAFSQSPTYTARQWIRAIVHQVVCLFTPQLLLALAAPTQGGMARLSWPGWIG